MRAALPARHRTLQNFIDGARLKSLPVVLSKKRIVLRWLAKRFDSGRRYEEREVNRLLEQAHPDFATLRRELVDNGLMERERGMYWLAAPTKADGVKDEFGPTTA